MAAADSRSHSAEQIQLVHERVRFITNLYELRRPLTNLPRILHWNWAVLSISSPFPDTGIFQCCIPVTVRALETYRIVLLLITENSQRICPRDNYWKDFPNASGGNGYQAFGIEQHLSSSTTRLARHYPRKQYRNRMGFRHW